MKKLVALLLSLCLVFGMLAMASAETETRTASAPGFGGDVTVTVTLEDGKIVGIGAHENLIKSCEVYREIHLSQTE